MNFNIKKQSILALTCSLAIYSTAFAAEVNPFDDVPTNHWAYASISKLAKAGIIDGFSDGKFRGGNVLTRYEMAAVIGKAMSNAAKQDDQLKTETKAELQKLEGEFSAELKNLGVRIATLEENSSSVKIGGSARIRFQANPLLTATNKNSTTPTRIQERFTLNLKAKVADNITFYGDIYEETKFNNRAVEGAKNSSIATTNNVQSLWADRAEFLWKNGNNAVQIGRFYATLGQGSTIWSGGTGNGLDGIYATHNFNDKLSLSAGYADMDATICNGVGINARLANLKYKASDSTTFTVANLKVLNNPTVPFTTQLPLSISGGTNVINTKYYFDQVAVGTKIVNGDWTYTAEVERNNADGLPSNAQRNAFDVKIQWKTANKKKPGTYSLAGEYMKYGNWATDSDWWKIDTYIPGGNYIGGDGAKGFGLDYHYIVATNLDFNLKYYRLKPYDSSVSGFDSYKPFYSVVTNWSF